MNSRQNADPHTASNTNSHTNATAKRKRSTLDAESVKRLRKTAGLFFYFAIPSLLCFIAPTLLKRVFVWEAPAFYVRYLTAAVTDPFAACDGIRDGALRILLYSLPSLLSVTALLCSVLLTKNAKKALRGTLSVLTLLFGIRFSALRSIIADLGTGLSVGLLQVVCMSIEVLLAACLLTYAYRISLCMLLGFPRRRAVPGTVGRFLSFTLRFLLWSLLLTLLRIGAVLLL